MKNYYTVNIKHEGDEVQMSSADLDRVHTFACEHDVIGGTLTLSVSTSCGGNEMRLGRFDAYRDQDAYDFMEAELGNN